MKPNKQRRAEWLHRPASAAEARPARKRAHTPKPIPDLANLPDEAFLTRQQLAALSGYTEQAFKKWAREGRGPRVTRIEGRPRYKVGDSREWLGLCHE